MIVKWPDKCLIEVPKNQKIGYCQQYCLQCKICSKGFPDGILNVWNTQQRECLTYRMPNCWVFTTITLQIPTD